MTTLFNMGRDINGFCAFSLMFPDDKVSTTLIQNTPQSAVVPDQANYYIAVFSYAPGSSIWVSLTGSASTPGVSFATTNSVLNPATLWVNGGSTISVVTGDAKDQIGISFYALSN